MENMNRNERRKAMRKELIRQTAIDTFFELGYLKTSINEIMERADLGYGTFYQYYENKLDVMREMVVEVLEKITKYYQKPPRSETNLYRRTLHSVKNILHTCYEHRKVLLVLKEVQTVDPELKKLWESIMEELFKRLDTDITWSMKKGICRKVDLTIALIALNGLVKGTIEYVIENEFSAEEIDRISENVSLLFKEAIFIQDEMP